MTNIQQPLYWEISGKKTDLSEPRVMGIINVTPDSFFEGSRKQDIASAVEQAGIHLDAGATFLDIGAYSSRPGAKDISENEEMDRLLPVVSAVSANFPDACISVDTFRAQVARQAIGHGAHIVNDISGGNLDEGMLETVAALGVPYIFMHMRGTPQTMKSLTDYDDMLAEIGEFMHTMGTRLRALGISRYCFDPGFGFAKTIAQNYSLLQSLHLFRQPGVPLLVGLSRKSMAWKPLNIPAGNALNATTVLHTLALQQGANILRVHDVKEAMQCIKILSLYQSAEAPKGV